MLKTKFLLLVLLCYSFTIYGIYAEDKVYTLSDCLDLAITRSLTLADQRELVLQAEEHYQQAIGASLPNISAGVGFSSQHLTSGANAFPNQTTAKFSATQPLFRGFRIVNAIKQNKTLIQAQKEANQWAAYQLYSDVAQGYYLRLYLLRDKQLLEEQQRLYERRLQELRERVQIGRSRKSEVLNFEVSLALLKTQIAAADQQIKASATLMYFLTGLGSSAKLKDISTTIDPVKSLSDYKNRIVLRPDVRAAQNRLLSAGTAVEITEGARLPAVDFSTNYYLLHDSNQKYSDWDAQLSVSLPLFTGSILESKTTEAKSVRHQIELAIQLLQRQIEQNIDDIYHNLEAEKNQIDLLGQALDYSDRFVNATVQDYRNGLSTNLDVLQAMNAYVDTKRTMNKMQYAYKTDLAKLSAAAADTPLPGDTK